MFFMYRDHIMFSFFSYIRRLWSKPTENSNSDSKKHEVSDKIRSSGITGVSSPSGNSIHEPDNKPVTIESSEPEPVPEP